jgi:hypothetical protein
VERKVRIRLELAVWSVVVSVAYLVLAMVDNDLAESLVVAFVALLLVPVAVVEEKEARHD